MRYCSCHSNIKFISSRHRVISSIYVSVKFPSKVAKFQSNRNIEILLIHEDCESTTIFILKLLNGLLVLMASNFRNWWKKCEKKNWMFFWKGFARLLGRKLLHGQFPNFIGEIHLGAAIDRFLRSLPLNNPFSVISDPASFIEAKQSIRAFAKYLRKRATLPVY